MKEAKKVWWVTWKTAVKSLYQLLGRRDGPQPELPDSALSAQGEPRARAGAAEQERRRDGPNVKQSNMGPSGVEMKTKIRYQVL